MAVAERSPLLPPLPPHFPACHSEPATLTFWLSNRQARSHLRHLQLTFPLLRTLLLSVAMCTLSFPRSQVVPCQ